ncbi:MAG: RNA polymerase sigma factor (sigma-70 family) [Polaribacter sp.]
MSQDLQSQLLQECIDGNRQAQQMLYERYAHRFLNIAYRVVWHKEDARDVVQESFMKIFSSLRGLKETVKFEGWAKRIVVNNAITLLRQKGKMPLYDLESADDFPFEKEDPVDEGIQQWNITIAKKALSELAPGYRTIISLYLLEGYDHKEISEIMGISVSTSITQFNRGKKRLKEKVKFAINER